MYFAGSCSSAKRTWQLLHILNVTSIYVSHDGSVALVHAISNGYNKRMRSLVSIGKINALLSKQICAGAYFRYDLLPQAQLNFIE